MGQTEFQISLLSTLVSDKFLLRSIPHNDLGPMFSVTRWLNYLLNIRPFAQINCSKRSGAYVQCDHMTKLFAGQNLAICNNENLPFSLLSLQCLWYSE